MKLGDLSAQYESNGDPGAISSGAGDAGGKSYGSYQFASSAGVPQEFVEWLCDNNRQPFCSILSQPSVGSLEFDIAWLKLAKDFPNEFANVQHEFIFRRYYVPAAGNLAQIGIYLDNRSEALRQVVWSRAVQYSPEWMADLFNEAAELARQDLSEMSDQDLIFYIYEANLTDPDWTAGSPDLRPGLFDRFVAERQDALAMLEV